MKHKRDKLLILLLSLSFALTACATPNSSVGEFPTPPSLEDGLPPESDGALGGESNGEGIGEQTPEIPETPVTPDQDGNGGNGGNGGNQPPQSDKEEDKNEETSPDDSQENLGAAYILCTGESVNIRAGAGSSYTVLGQAEKGNMYATNGKIGNWYQIFYKNKVGYLHASYAHTFEIEKSKKQAVEEVLATAYLLLGVPYVYGAVRYHDGYGNKLKNFTMQKFDCSSLTQYAFFIGAGILLQTTTRTQVVQGKYVAPNDLQRGDCIYFTNETRKYLTGVERVGHVAIYLGDNYILHTSSDYARIEKMNNYRWNFYIEARRFI